VATNSEISLIMADTTKVWSPDSEQSRIFVSLQLPKWSSLSYSTEIGGALLIVFHILHLNNTYNSLVHDWVVPSCQCTNFRKLPHLGEVLFKFNFCVCVCVI